MDDLFLTLRRLCDTGHSLIFISHKLHEVMKISDRITVLRDGRVVGSTKTSETNTKELARMMVGRDVVTKWDRAPPASPRNGPRHSGAGRAERQGAARGQAPVAPGPSGEILGIAGVSGNGQPRTGRDHGRSAPRAEWPRHRCAGATSPTATPPGSSTRALPLSRRERMTMGVIRDFTVQENFHPRDACRCSSPAACSGFWEDQRARDQVGARVRGQDPTLDTPVKSLSGGNIQKLILARELTRDPKILVAAAGRPAASIIGATEYIHKRLIEQRERGTAILLISEDLDEVLALADRIAVMYEGEIVGIVPPSTPVDDLGLMMAGAKRMIPNPLDNPGSRAYNSSTNSSMTN